MPFVKDTFTLLSELASTEVDTDSYITETAIRTRMSNIQEASEEIRYGANTVVVMTVDEGYYTDIDHLAPYMKTNGISTIAEALDNVAFANNLPAKSVGLLIESDVDVETMLEKANSKKDKKAKKAALNKINKGNELAKKLQKDGYDVKKKKGTVCVGKMKVKGVAGQHIAVGSAKFKGVAVY